MTDTKESGSATAGLEANAEATQKLLDEQAEADEQAAQAKGGHAPGYEFTEKGKKEIERNQRKAEAEARKTEAKAESDERRESRESKPRPTQLPADTHTTKTEQPVATSGPTEAKK